ncbi:MAG: hypothetical protein ABJZ55_17025 [Fuerstiella sp.]
MSESTPSPPFEAADHNVDLLVDAAPEALPHSWLVSLSFWGTLLVAAAIYASVALAPKFCVWNRVRLQQHQNAERLATLESEVGYLERVEKALATDPEFRSRASGSSTKTDSKSELIPVSGNLLFGNHAVPIETSPQLATIPLYHSLAELLATDRSLRTSLLALTTFLALFAFAILNDAGTDLVVAGKNAAQSTVSWPFRRYMRPAEATPPKSTQAEVTPADNPEPSAIEAAEPFSDDSAAPLNNTPEPV